MSRFDRYMAIPFVDKGRTFAGVDCFGMYSLIVANEAGIEVPDPGVSFGNENRKGVEAAIAAELARGDWCQIEKSQQFDAVVMTGFAMIGRLATRGDFHIGCMIDESTMIHTELQTGPRMYAIDDPEIAHRIRFFARPAVLMQRVAA